MTEPTIEIEYQIHHALNVAADLLGAKYCDEYAPRSLPALDRTRAMLRIAEGVRDSKVVEILSTVLHEQTHRTVLEAERCTLYIRDELLGIQKYELRSVKAERAPYAQHADALHLTFTPKGGRRAREFSHHNPYVLILAGWGHPDPDGMFEPTGEKVAGVRVERGRYSACDPRWESDFDAKIANHLKTARVLLDARRNLGAVQ